MDHFFVIGVSESERLIRCILCKGSYYPPTNPRPILHEIPLIIPLCEPDSEKSEKEAKVWQLGSHPEEEKEAVLMLIALACRSNVEFRAVELCQQIASQKVIELAIKYAARNNRMALANKLESIGEDKGQQELDQQLENDKDCFENQNNEIEEELDFAPIVKKTEIEIRPISLSQGQRRNNPFLKKGNVPKLRGLAALGEPEEPQKPKPVTVVQKPKTASTKAKKTESFVSWFSRNKKHLQEEFPENSITELTKLGLSKFKENPQDIKSKESPQVIKSKESSEDLKSEEENVETKKRKLSESEETTPVSEPKRSAFSKLAAFANDK